MKKFTIACYWQEYDGLPPDPEYVDGSFEVNEEISKELSKEEVSS